LAIFDLGRGFADAQTHAHEAEDGRVSPDRRANRDRVGAEDRHRRFPEWSQVNCSSEHTIGKVDRLLNVVGKEKNCFFRFARLRMN